jgi:hypothetical protein
MTAAASPPGSRFLAASAYRNQQSLPEENPMADRRIFFSRQIHLPALLEGDGW